MSAAELIWPDPADLSYEFWREAQLEMTDSRPALPAMSLRQLLDLIADDCRKAGLLS